MRRPPTTRHDVPGETAERDGRRRDGPQPRPGPASGAAADLEQEVAGLARAVAEIPHALRRAERRIEGDARGRVGRLRAQAREQLAVLYGDHRHALQLVSQLATGRVQDGQIREAARRAVSSARATADAMIAALRDAMLD